MQTSTWAGRGTAAGRTGEIIEITDIGVGGGSLWSSDGTNWVPIAPITLARSGAKISIPNNTLLTEQVYVTVPIPAGAMGLLGAVYVDTLWTVTASTNSKTMRSRFGGASGTAFINTAISSATLVTARLTGIDRNSDATHQVCAPAGAAGGTTTGTTAVVARSSIDTTVAQTLVISGLLGVAAEVIDLEWHEVRLLP